MKDTIRQIIGKRIQCVIVNERNDTLLRQQMFLVFDDGTYFELYGHISPGSGLDSGGEAAALKYARKADGRIQKFVAE